MYVCMYVCTMYVCMYVRTIYVCMYVRTVCIRTYPHHLFGGLGDGLAVLIHVAIQAPIFGRLIIVLVY